MKFPVISQQKLNKIENILVDNKQQKSVGLI